MEQLELLCVRPATVSAAPDMSFTGCVSIHKDKPHRRKPVFAVLRRSAAFCLSLTMLAATSAGQRGAADAEHQTALSSLLIRSEIAGFQTRYNLLDLPILSLADALQSHVSPGSPTQQGATAAPPLTSSIPEALDTGLDFPANRRGTNGLIAPCKEQAPEETVRELTVAPASAYGYDVCQNVFVLNGTKKQLPLADMLSEPLKTAEPTGQPQVYIYHTHTGEAYTPGALDTYETDSSDRCTNPAYNVVRVGEEIASVLRSHGIGVIHDTTAYDSPSYTGAYKRSLAAVQAAMREHPSIEVVIDVHRDALNQPQAQKYKLVADLGTQKTAQVMMVIGTDTAAGDHPHWRKNLKLALRVQKNMAYQWPTLARPIKLTRSSYNQFSAIGAMIVEVGANGNSLAEAVQGGHLYAEALAAALMQTNPS